MKTLKTGIVLLVLLLATMAMVPMVSAVEQKITTASSDQTVVTAVDASKMVVPNLHFDNSQKTVMVNGELSPRQNLQTAQMTAISMASGVNAIPFGSIIYHAKDGVTTVFDSKGNQLFTAEDAKSVRVSTPQNDAPATFVHEVPSGSISREVDGTTYVFYNGELILTIINENVQDSAEIRSINTDDQQNGLPSLSGANSRINAALANYLGWIEYTESTPVTASRFEATWVAPTSTPLNSGVRESLGIWNGIERTGIDGVMQPVLMWNFCAYGDAQIHNNYVGSAWDYQTTSNPNKDSLHSTPISVLPGDTVKGILQWSPTLNCWIIQFNNIRSGQTTAYYSSRFPRDNLKLYVVLEAAAAGIKPNNNSLTGSITFNNIIVQNQGSNVAVTFTGHVMSGASSIFPGLSAVVSTNPQLQLFLRTGR